MYDDGWNRYMRGDENAPEWFLRDERMHNSPGVKVRVFLFDSIYAINCAILLYRVNYSLRC